MLNVVADRGGASSNEGKLSELGGTFDDDGAEAFGPRVGEEGAVDEGESSSCGLGRRVVVECEFADEVHELLREVDKGGHGCGREER